MAKKARKKTKQSGKKTKKNAATKTKEATPRKKLKGRKKATAKIAMTRALTAHSPYKCETTDIPGTCLKFYWNERAKKFNLPPGGERVPCSECRYWFD